MEMLNVPTRRGTVLNGVLFPAQKADTVVIAITGIHGNFYSNPFYDNFTEGDPSKFLRNINSHMPTAAQNKLIFIERTGHTYQQKHQEIADEILKLTTDWIA